MKEERFKNHVFFKEGPGLGSADFTNTGVPLLRINNVGNYYVNLEGCSFISEDTAKKYSQYKTRIEDLIISGSASFGIVSEINELSKNCIPYTGLIILRPKKGLTKDYLKWFVSSLAFKNQIEEHKTGSTIQHFGPTHLKRMNINIYSLEQQNKISNFLNYEISKIDRKISILEQKFDKLEEYKQSVIFETVTNGLNSSVTMKDSGIDWIGDIPEHWEVKRLKNIAIIKKGETFDDNLSSANGIYPYINGGISPSDWSNSFNTSENTIAVSEGGASAGYTQFMNTKYWAGSHCYKIKAKNTKSNNKYIYYILKGFEKHLMIEKTGSAMPNLQKTKFINYTVSCTYDIIEQDRIVNFLESEISKIEYKKEIIQKQIKLLQEYKQSIIFEAVTGKMEII